MASMWRADICREIVGHPFLSQRVIWLLYNLAYCIATKTMLNIYQMFVFRTCAVTFSLPRTKKKVPTILKITHSNKKKSPYHSENHSFPKNSLNPVLIRKGKKIYTSMMIKSWPEQSLCKLHDKWYKTMVLPDYRW